MRPSLITILLAALLLAGCITGSNASRHLRGTSALAASDRSDRQALIAAVQAASAKSLAAEAASADVNQAATREFQETKEDVASRMASMKHVSTRWAQPPSTPL